MKKIMIICSAVFMPLWVFAQSANGPMITEDQKNAFASIAHVAVDNVVPKMIDVPLFMDQKVNDRVLVADDKGEIVPAAVITNTRYMPINYTVADSFGSADAQNMMDGSYDSFTEFPFEEKKDKKNTEKNSVDIDIVADRVFQTDMVSFQFDAHIHMPTRVRIVSVADSGEEHVLLPERNFTGSTITFPRENADHYRITLTYEQPLRINEITFTEDGIPRTVEKFVRFVSAPHAAYDIYFDARDHVDIPVQEKPNFMAQSAIAIVQPVSVQTNTFFKKGDQDRDGIVDESDNCPNVVNADQDDKDKNGIGDACEDFDFDGIINMRDNCVDRPNRAQEDVDQDGVGDACDGWENRFIERNAWIPTAVLVIVSIIVIALIVRTFKKK